MAAARFGQMFVAVALCVAGTTGCSRPLPDATPDGVLRLWLEKMEASDEDPRETREAYDLLGVRAKKNLAERAERAGRAEGRHVEPWEVLAEGRFELRFRPQRMTAKIDPSGDTATVEVMGADPVVEHAVVECDRVAASNGTNANGTGKDAPGGWRVEPSFPPLPPLAGRSPGSP